MSTSPAPNVLVRVQIPGPGVPAIAPTVVCTMAITATDAQIPETWKHLGPDIRVPAIVYAKPETSADG